MAKGRKKIAMRELLAAALAQLLPPEQALALRQRHASHASVRELFEFDHARLKALEGEDLWWNLYPMLKPDHRAKSTGDTKVVAKVKRVAPEHARHIAVMRRKILGTEPAECPSVKPLRPKKKMQSRPFPSGQRRLASARGGLSRPRRAT